jgi:hypothetical protein
LDVSALWQSSLLLWVVAMVQLVSSFIRSHTSSHNWIDLTACAAFGGAVFGRFSHAKLQSDG